MDNVRNYFEVKYCALCFEPLDDFGGTCPMCEQKTTALNFSERLNRDHTISEKDRSAPRFAAILITIGCVLQILYGTVAIFWTAGIIKDPYKSSGNNFLLHEPTEQEQKVQRQMNEALKYDDVLEYVRSKNPQNQEEIQYYHAIWNQAWFNYNITHNNNTNEHTYPQDPLLSDKRETEQSGQTEHSTLFQIGGTVGICLSAAFIIMSLGGLALCVMTFMEKDKSVMYLWWFTGGIAQLVLITLNFFSVALFIAGMYTLQNLHEHVCGGKLSRSRAWKIHKAKNPIGDTNKWCCKYCGYINIKRDSECKSCGKYK